MPHSKKNKLVNKELSNDIYAALYLQLAHLEDAGIPTKQAFEIVNNKSPKTQHHIGQTLKYLSLGKTVTEAGLIAGVFNHKDKELLIAGETSGRLGETYKQLATFYEQKAKRLKKIKSQCYLPAIIFILGIFIQPIPALFLNQISAFEYIFSCIATILKIAILLYIMIKLPSWLTKGPLQFLGLKNWIYKIQYHLPLLSSWLIHKQVNSFMASLGLMLSAGISILDALPKAINTISNPLVKKQFLPLISATNNGNTLSTAIANIDDLDDQAKQLIVAGESSGKLADTLIHIAALGNQTIDMQEDLFTQWVPKIFYLIITGWLASSIFSSHTLNTSSALL